LFAGLPVDESVRRAGRDATLQSVSPVSSSSATWPVLRVGRDRWSKRFCLTRIGVECPGSSGTRQRNAPARRSCPATAGARPGNSFVERKYLRFPSAELASDAIVVAAAHKNKKRTVLDQAWHGRLNSSRLHNTTFGRRNREEWVELVRSCHGPLPDRRMQRPAPFLGDESIGAMARSGWNVFRVHRVMDHQQGARASVWLTGCAVHDTVGNAGRAQAVARTQVKKRVAVLDLMVTERHDVPPVAERELRVAAGTQHVPGPRHRRARGVDHRERGPRP